MRTIRNARQVTEERQRLQQREGELRNNIRQNLANLTGRGHLPVEKDGTLLRKECDDGILIAVFTYTGALLGRKLAVYLNKKIHEVL